MFNVLLGVFLIIKYAELGGIQAVDLKPFLKRRFAVIRISTGLIHILTKSCNIVHVRSALKLSGKCADEG